MENPAPEPIDEEHPEKIIDEMEDILDDLHVEFADAASVIGEEKERIQALRPVWKSLAESNTDSPEYADLFHTGVNALVVHRDQLRDYRNQYGKIGTQMQELSGSTASTVAITSVTQSFISKGLVSVTPAPPTLPPRDETKDVEVAPFTSSIQLLLQRILV